MLWRAESSHSSYQICHIYLTYSFKLSCQTTGSNIQWFHKKKNRSNMDKWICIIITRIKKQCLFHVWWWQINGPRPCFPPLHAILSPIPHTSVLIVYSVSLLHNESLVSLNSKHSSFNNTEGQSLENQDDRFLKNNSRHNSFQTFKVRNPYCYVTKKNTLSYWDVSLC